VSERGRIGWYVVAFGLLTASAVVIVVSSLDLDFDSRPLWISFGLSIAAIALAIAAIGLRRRR